MVWQPVAVSDVRTNFAGVSSKAEAKFQYEDSTFINHNGDKHHEEK
jgi:hypothetical protein